MGSVTHRHGTARNHPCIQSECGSCAGARQAKGFCVSCAIGNCACGAARGAASGGRHSAPVAAGVPASLTGVPGGATITAPWLRATASHLETPRRRVRPESRLGPDLI